jgi:hypothetical protein
MPASVALLSAAGLECLYDGNEVMARGNATQLVCRRSQIFWLWGVNV